MNEHGKSPIFCDWVTIVERHPEGVRRRYPEGVLPLKLRGIHVWADKAGVTRLERISAAHLGGSHSTALLLGCDGFNVFLSGNVGRFARKDNVFNLGWRATLEKCQRILDLNGLPRFSVTKRLPDDDQASGDVVGGARLLRVDITGNFSTGSIAQAKALVRWARGLEISRHRPGAIGDWSAWWVNTSRMIKLYVKSEELRAHGAARDDRVAAWCEERGVVRMEVELKRRELQRLGLNHLGDVTDEKLAAAFEDETAFLRKVDRSDEPDILAELPAGSRVYAAAWLKGQDLRQLVSRRTFFRHARVLKGFDIDITQPRNIHNFPVKVRVVDLCPLSAPDWYEWDEAA